MFRGWVFLGFDWLWYLLLFPARSGLKFGGWVICVWWFVGFDIFGLGVRCLGWYKTEIPGNLASGARLPCLGTFRGMMDFGVLIGFCLFGLEFAGLAVLRIWWRVGFDTWSRDGVFGVGIRWVWWGWNFSGIYFG